MTGEKKRMQRSEQSFRLALLLVVVV